MERELSSSHTTPHILYIAYILNVYNYMAPPQDLPFSIKHCKLQCSVGSRGMFFRYSIAREKTFIYAQLC